MTRLTATEHQIQVTFFEALGWRLKEYPELALMHAIPNSGAGAQGGRAGWLKAEGVKPGVPDAFLPVARAGWHGLYIEFKSAVGELSDAQERVGLELLAQGYAVMVFDDAEEAVRAVVHYLRSGFARDDLEPDTLTPNRLDAAAECKRFFDLARERQAHRRDPKRGRRAKVAAT